MRPVWIITALISAAVLAVTGCSARPSAVRPAAAASAPAPAATGNRPAQTPPPTATTAAAPSPPHFATPQAAMRYLALAYNHIDLVSLKHVTTPEARSNLLVMRPHAVNLRLVGCTANAGRGDYSCSFTHDYPATMHQAGSGHAHFTAAPPTTSAGT